MGWRVLRSQVYLNQIISLKLYYSEEYRIEVFLVFLAKTTGYKLVLLFFQTLYFKLVIIARILKLLFNRVERIVIF